MERQMFGEFMGTLVLILMGNGAVANVLLKKSKAEDSGWIVIATGWALAVLIGVLTSIACGSADANLNPAVTLGAAVKTGDFSKFFPFLAAQLAGAMAGATLVWLNFYPHWRETYDAGRKAACFFTAPAIRNYGSNLFSEILGSFVLVVVAGAIFSKAVSPTGPAAGFGPYLVGSLVWGIGLSLGGTTGYAINPARDFGPRLAHAILPIAKKGGSDWAYAPVPIVGPLVGGMLAGLFMRVVGF